MIKVERVYITPQKAEELLTRNVDNRTLNSQRIANIARDIRVGKWLEDANPIKVCTDGGLLDGQHRLHAIASAGIPVYSLIAYNVSRPAQLVMDSGRSRTWVDNSGFLDPGTAYTNDLAAAIRLLILFDKGLPLKTHSNNVVPTNAEMTECFEKHKDILKCNVSHTNSLLPRSLTTFFTYILGKKDQELATKFLDTLNTGVDMKKDTGVYLLHKRLVENKVKKLGMTSQYKAAITVKAWNSHVEGNKSVKSLKWDAANEPFPAILKPKAKAKAAA